MFEGPNSAENLIKYILIFIVNSEGTLTACVNFCRKSTDVLKTVKVTKNAFPP